MPTEIIVRPLVASNWIAGVQHPAAKRAGENSVLTILEKDRMFEVCERFTAREIVLTSNIEKEGTSAVLTGIHPMLTGELLAYLDAMGHSDAVLVADANFPAERLANRVLVFPGLTAPDVLRAIRTVIPLDDAPTLDLMTSASGATLPVQGELIAAAGTTRSDVRFLERKAFYEISAEAFLLVRTGETRAYANALLRKGFVTADQTPAGTGQG